MAVLQLFCLLFITTSSVDSAKVLIMVTTPSPSLFNVFKPIIEELSARNHEITLQTYFSMKKPLPNFKELMLKPGEFDSDEDVLKNLLMQMTAAGPISEVFSYAATAGQICEEYLTDSSTKELMKDGKQFDLVLADGFFDCPLAAASLLAKHVTTLYGSGNFPLHYSDVPAPPSYVPNYFRRIPSTMSFWQRLNNAIDVAAFRIINDFLRVPAQQKLLSQYLPQAPEIVAIRDKVILTLTNSDPVMYSPRPSMANSINCGGLHCRDAEPLPKELNDFVQSSGDEGFIMFGLGTNMKSKFLPPEIRDAILSAFSRLKQKVIWKFEAQLHNLPRNVMITKWMPQQDLLGHPKVRLFITHSGLLSLQEAIYHGVPVIGMPFFMDQSGNVARVQELGIGEYMDFFNVTADGFYELINKVLTDKSYRENAKKYSAVFKDQPVKPLDNAIFWIEYILRHDGMNHFRPAARDLNFFQYFLLDVIGFLLVITALTGAILYFLLRLLYRKLSLNVKKPGSDLEKKTK